MDRSVLEELIQKTAEFVPSESRWRVYYLGFARGGWLSEAKGLAKTFGDAKVQGENWRAVGMNLLDLSKIDQDLKDWSNGNDEDVDIPI